MLLSLQTFGASMEEILAECPQNRDTTRAEA
jgi:hypothetical protein